MRPRNLTLVAIVFVALCAMAVPTPPAHAQDFFGDGWTVDYYDNANLSGSPVFTDNVSRVDINFGESSGGGSVPVDNFSAVFTTTEIFQSNTTYEFVATADEGVRVIVGGQTVIDAFAGPPGTYSGTIATVGSQTIRVEFRELTGTANISVFWRIAAPAARTFPPGAITATVINASALVVREQPFLSGTRIGTVRRGETFLVVGRDADARWFLLELADGRRGWAWGFYLFIDANEFNAPVVNPFTLDGIDDAQFVVQTIDGPRLRAEPNLISPQIGRIDFGVLLPVLGRCEVGEWYLVRFKDTDGWIFAPLTRPVQGNINSVPFVPGCADLVNRTAPAADPNYDISVP